MDKKAHPISHRLLFVAMLVVGAAYRLPGVSWGFDIDTPVYSHSHPDEGIACLDAMEHGVAELGNGGNPAERGMMFQCAVLGLAFEPQTGIIPRARIGRTYSVLWGLLAIALTALIARRLRSETAGLFAGLLLATSGVNIITSFWVRGQIQNVAFFMASVLVALQVRKSKEQSVPLLFVAAALAGAAIATRWSFGLIPMLLGCAIARGPIVRQLAATAVGGLFGFFASTGFFWTPALVAMNFEFQRHNLVTLYSRIGPLTTGAAALVCILAGTGLVTCALALWSGVDWARRLRNFRREDGTWARLRSSLDGPGVIIALPILITFAMLCFNKAFDARYTDLFAPPLAIVAGIRMADLWERWTGRRRILIAALLAYQGVYGASMVARYTWRDSRKVMNATVADVWKPKGPIYATAYVSYSSLYEGYGIAPGQSPWDAEWIAISDVYAGQYLTPSGTFPFAGAPANCREILYCDGEPQLAFIQKLYAHDGWDQVYVAHAPAWTPEIKLHHALMTSKWMFTGDIRLFHKRPLAR